MPVPTSPARRRTHVLDTSVLLADPACLGRFAEHEVVLPVVVLMELELWPGFSRCCNVAGIPLAIVNGRITAESYARYHRFRGLLPQFNRISLFCAQNPVYADRFAKLSRQPERVLITGNMKADGVCTGALRQRDAELSELVASKREQTIVAGSTHEPEERMVARAWRRGAPLSRLILVPRHPERAEDIRRSLGQEGFQSERPGALQGGGQQGAGESGATMVGAYGDPLQVGDVTDDPRHHVAGDAGAVVVHPGGPVRSGDLLLDLAVAPAVREPFHGRDAERNRLHLLCSGSRQERLKRVAHVVGRSERPGSLDLVEHRRLVGVETADLLEGLGLLVC